MSMLNAFSKKELDCQEPKSLKDLLLKDQSWWRYYQKHKESIRVEVLETISNILSCGLTVRGFSFYECSNPSCTHTKKVAFTCHNRFCSKCGKKATENWIHRQLAILPSCRFQHITFTMPRELWRFFQGNWFLLNQLPAVAANILQKIARSKGLIIGLFIALHTFGRDLKHNPHLHASTTCGGLNQTTTRFITCYFKKKIIMRMWRYDVIKLLKKAYSQEKLSLPDSLNALCQNSSGFNAWLNKRFHKPWIIHLAKPTNSPMVTISYLGRYLRRPPIAQSRLRHYDGNYVVFNFLNHKTNKHQHYCCSTDEFIRRFIQHIPQKHFRMVRYYGFLANRVRGDMLPLVRLLLGQDPKPKTYNMKYAQIMQKTLGINPKECILCQSDMTCLYRRIGPNATFFYDKHDTLALRKRLLA